MKKPQSGALAVLVRKQRLAAVRTMPCVLPHCKARAALESQNIKPGAMEWVEIDNRPDCSEIQDYLQRVEAWLVESCVPQDRSTTRSGPADMKPMKWTKLNIKSLTGARSVPRVFINQKFFGGGDDTAAAAKNGKLAQLLKEAQAI
ncbi:hypothetical protein ANCCEY_06223 [Ancylostoma ceylanicum]|uniref:Uncharacterized protein n=1 Tax=Ancylostoma ceylanicum TaxID=53326 RepID=A0A0D6LRJ0_9BILA|nr:hypothetical protein ANCCEY_06223 [Ancylostoma ceylanicum]